MPRSAAPGGFSSPSKCLCYPAESATIDCLFHLCLFRPGNGALYCITVKMPYLQRCKKNWRFTETEINASILVFIFKLHNDIMSNLKYESPKLCDQKAFQIENHLSFESGNHSLGVLTFPTREYVA